MSKIIYGSINLSKANKAGQIKKVQLKDGTTALFLQLAVCEKKEPKTFTDEATGKARTYTHFVTCAPPKEKQVPETDYYIGDLQTWETRPDNNPTEEQVAAAEAVEETDDLPF